MSAKNWATCPACYKKALAAQTRSKLKLEEAYGRVSIEEFSELQEIANRPIVTNQSLREDYHLGINADQVFELLYKAACQHCDYQYTIAISKPQSLELVSRTTGDDSLKHRVKLSDGSYYDLIACDENGDNITTGMIAYYKLETSEDVFDHQVEIEIIRAISDSCQSIKHIKDTVPHGKAKGRARWMAIIPAWLIYKLPRVAENS